MEAAQAYVMLSRVQALSQLFILEDVCEKKIYASNTALETLNKMNTLAINNKHSKSIVVSCNIRSLNRHHRDLITTPSLMASDVICLQETWITGDFQKLEIPGFTHSFNNGGRGKGIATYYGQSYYLIKDIRQDMYQITKVGSNDLEIINIYRSDGASTNALIKDISRLIDQSKITIIVGDLNICFLSERKHPVVVFIERKGFNQLVVNPTHTNGRLLDHVYQYIPHAQKEAPFKVEQQSPYYTDHDILWIS